jgi:L-2-hydroxyglutarate oxidase
MTQTELVVIGGGIVGLATAYAFLGKRPGASVVCLEKEDGPARHQTGRNSGVIHSGLYYKPGSKKALNCRRGKKLLEEFCAEHGVAYELCGKVVVAVDDAEIERLGKLHERGVANGVRCEMISAERCREIEPHVACRQAMHVPETGIVDYKGMCAKLVELIEKRGGRFVGRAKVLSIKKDGASNIVRSTAGDFAARLVANCAGLHSDRVAAMTEKDRDVRIVPFRGEYFSLVPTAEHLCKNLIYPVPDPSFPFLGVHFTRMVKGGVECGPNAVLAFAREGYTKGTISPRDLFDVLTYGGFWKLAKKHWRTGSMEMWRSFSRAAFTSSLQRLIPEVRIQDLVPAPAGVRAQALAQDGSLVDDFAIRESGGIVHVLNAPSPAATSSLAIGETVVEHLAAADRHRSESR